MVYYKFNDFLPFFAWNTNTLAYNQHIFDAWATIVVHRCGMFAMITIPYHTEKRSNDYPAYWKARLLFGHDISQTIYLLNSLRPRFLF